MTGRNQRSSTSYFRKVSVNSFALHNIVFFLSVEKKGKEKKKKKAHSSFDPETVTENRCCTDAEAFIFLLLLFVALHFLLLPLCSGSVFK